ncbi:MAG: hypothetical protein IJF55_04355, partial [Clostridia bacterium]|nr:hypothetical protein [Clostridia bacterium]
LLLGRRWHPNRMTDEEIQNNTARHLHEAIIFTLYSSLTNRLHLLFANEDVFSQNPDRVSGFC